MIAEGYRESAQSWREVLLDLKRRGLAIAPELATGDGALGFWKALREVYGTTREQRCWVHKTANVLTKLPKSVPPRAKQHRQDIWMAETRAVAEKAFDFIPRGLWPQVRQSGGLPGQGPRRVARLLRLPGRALEAHSHHQSHRKHLCDRAPPDHQDQGLPQPHDGAHHGLQAVPVGQQ